MSSSGFRKSFAALDDVRDRIAYVQGTDASSIIIGARALGDAALGPSFAPVRVPTWRVA